jgi:hypothetical protein
MRALVISLNHSGATQPDRGQGCLANFSDLSIDNLRVIMVEIAVGEYHLTCEENIFAALIWIMEAGLLCGIVARRRTGQRIISRDRAATCGSTLGDIRPMKLQPGLKPALRDAAAGAPCPSKLRPGVT